MTFDGAGNPLFLARNLLDDATLSASTAATPVDRLKNFRPSRKWYATGKTEEYVQFDLGAEDLVQHVGLVGFNTDTQSEVEVRLSNSATFSGADVGGSGPVELWEPVAGWGYDGFGVNMGGYPQLTAFNDYRALRIIDLGQSYAARYGRIYLRNPANPAIAQLGLGWAFAGLGFQTQWPLDFDWVEGWPDPSEVSLTQSSVSVREIKSDRVMSFQLKELSPAEAYGEWRNMARAIGRKKPMIVSLFPKADAPTRYATNIYCLRSDDPETNNPFVDQFTAGMTLREIPQWAS